MISRILLEATQPEIFQQEVQTAFGVVRTSRLFATDRDSVNNTITDIPVPANTTVQIRSIVLARHVSGSTGTVGTSGSWELVGTFKDVDGVLTQVGTDTLVVEHCDTTWSVLYEVYQNRLYLQAVLPSPAYGVGQSLVWNAYTYLHILGG